MSDETLPRRWELAADQALQGLCPDDWVEFDGVLPPGAERDELLLELEVIAADLASLSAAEEPLPADLAARLRASLPADLTGALAPRVTESPAGEVVPFPQRAAAQHPAAPHAAAQHPATQPNSRRADPVRWGGWLAAAAALLGWFVTSGPGARSGAPESGSSGVPVEQLARVPETPPTATPPEAAPPREPTPAEQLAHLAEESGTRVVSWQTTKDPAAQSVTGDLVWHAGKQQGFMRFRGLPKNDPRQLQYQLWIFDGERDERHPIDGGVFDAEHDGEIVVPIDPRVPVHRAQLFAITVEPPGGVVVSTRERIVVTAALPPT
jgi:hypothetical protein